MYWFITQRGGFEQASYVEDPEKRARFEATLQAILAAVRGGAFPAIPSDEDEWRGGFENCTYCDFDRICSRRRDLEYQAKAVDPATAPWSAVGEAAKANGG
jgi:hypothetical protein